MQTGEVRYIGVRYIGNEKDKRGVMINYCPFCGMRLTWWKPSEVKEVDDVGKTLKGVKP